ncbi:MAG: nuclear transport factor 2 family protein [Trebonia sp.]
MMDTFDPRTPVTQDLHRIIADGDYAVAEWTSHGRARNGAPYDNHNAVVFHVVDGRIDAVTEYSDTSYMKRVLFDQ